MSKIKKLNDGGLTFHCPGCDHAHSVNHAGGLQWQYNGDEEKPTFNPSILVTKNWKETPYVCHSFVRDGKIQFLDDCTHVLKGQTIDLPDWPHKRGEYGGIVE